MKLRGAVASLALLVLLQTSAPAQPPDPGQSDHLQFGNPGGGCSLVDRQIFVICYDSARRIPDWVAYRLRKSELAGNQGRTEDFRPDLALADSVRSELKDYRSSGYDRGHMAPAGDFTRSATAMSTTFLLSNMTPQRPRLNRGMWKRLEAQVRQLAGDSDTIWVVTGALFLTQTPPSYTPTIGMGRVAVPTHLYKVILARDSSGAFLAYGFVMPNSINPLPGKPIDFEKSVDDVEQISGLNFFDRLDNATQNRIEADHGNWPFH